MQLVSRTGTLLPNARRLRHVRSLSIGHTERDFLQMAEFALERYPPLGILEASTPAFNSVIKSEDHVLSIASACIEGAVLLDFLLANQLAEPNTSTCFSKGFYFRIAKEQFELAFDNDHAFWNTFNKRVSPLKEECIDRKRSQIVSPQELGGYIVQQFGGFLLPLDALFYLTDESFRLNYGLISQAYKWLLVARFGPAINIPVEKEAICKRALRLIEPLHIKGLDQLVAEFAVRRQAYVFPDLT